MRFFAYILSVFIAFMACTPVLEETPIPKLRPKAVPVQASIESQQDAAYYASEQARLLASGYLRQEILPSDARFTTRNLVENFERIALFDESDRIALLEESIAIEDKSIERQTPRTLRRWEKPIRIGITFGPSVTSQQRTQDKAHVDSFARHLARLSGLDIQLTNARRANFSLLFLNKDERHILTPQLLGKVKHLTPQIVDRIKHITRSVSCLAVSIPEDNPFSGYKGAIILIKDEQPGLLRKSCIQEEMAQALGLTNDSPDARPSSFNDDEEFALVTRHDELLIRMLYDPRLHNGMTIDVAHPIVQEIAQELISAGQK